MLVIPCLFSSKQLLCVDVMGFSIKKKTPERSAPWDRNTTCSGCGGDGNKLSPTSSTSGPRHAIMSAGNQRCSN